MAPFLHLPNELMLEISKSFSPADLYSLSLTNPRLAELYKVDLPNSVLENRPRALEFATELIWFLATNKNKDKILEMLEQGLLSKLGPTVLHDAIPTGDIGALEVVIDCGVGLGSLDNNGFSPLAVAVAAGRADVVRLLTAHPDVDVNETHPQRDWTALHLACLWKHPGVLKALVDEPAAYLRPDNPDWRITLEIARRGQDRQGDVINALLASDKVDVNQPVQGFTPLHLAVTTTKWKGLSHLQQLLGDPRVDKNPRDWMGRTPLNIAAAAGKYDVVRLLLADPAVDINMPTNGPGWHGGNKWTPLHSASAKGHKDVVRLLVNHHQIELNNKDSYDNTALNIAAMKGLVRIVGRLLSVDGIKLPSLCVTPGGGFLFPKSYSTGVRILFMNHWEKNHRPQTQEEVDEGYADNESVSYSN